MYLTDLIKGNQIVSHLKRQEADDIPQKQREMQTTPMIKRFSWIRLPKQNSAAWPEANNKKQMKQSSCVLNEEPSPFYCIRYLKLVDLFTYFGTNISSTESEFNTRIRKPLTAIDRLSNIWKSDLSDKIAVTLSVLVYRCTTWMQTKRTEQKGRWERNKNATNCFE